jgi:hypothetical protein
VQFLPPGKLTANYISCALLYSTLRGQRRNCFSLSVITRITVADPDKDSLTHPWEVFEETKTQFTGGDREEKPPAVSRLIQEQNNEG